MVANTVHGTGVVEGFAYGQVAWTRPAPVAPPAGGIVPEDGRGAEEARFQAAVEVVAGRFAARAEAAEGAAAEVMEASAALARDRGWVRPAARGIRQGATAETATTVAIGGFIEQLAQLGGRMAERTTDLADIRARVVAELMGLPEPGVPRPTHPVVLLADDLAPADTAGLDPSVVLAIVTRRGGPTSHTAIIARQLGIPCIVAAGSLGDIGDGEQVLVDGAHGVVTRSPDPDEAAELVAQDGALRAEIRAWRGPAATRDGAAIRLLANVQDGAGARAAAAESAAEGVGLFRTELCFLTAQTQPTLEEQAGLYAEVFAAFAGRKVVVRTLDAGSDKPVPFVHHAQEDNPALGVRGIRLASHNPELMTRQLDAIARAAHDAGAVDPHVMAPMVATVDEAAEFAAQCRERGLVPGIMVEVPAVALMAEEFLQVVDFFSIGTNDLTQYTMAADRTSGDLASLTTAWQPAVLRLIARTSAAGMRAGKPVGVCGEAAADPLLACVLTGMGITSLSMAYSAIPTVGVRLGKVTLEQCRSAAARVVEARSDVEAREVAEGLLR
ncbi:phosphoenolpyruvate--protein phosphotransferase [Tessaracoccus palaemonis]|uniref:Phosphoenolpyruvate-protein phosphotransferase n=1 Tax=Tessaracoccus palaemonis TaxID=2829499 RepID=A0ABX8SLZ5_9ACTN|nr:phosphoenolpyruvate--protein phosphotransferase [Tessaracoccus palaemonis]QXT63919.1 phosphoenolpyruvate--protein phosphotransferase [Tessaracoccus palaemonis]